MQWFSSILKPWGVGLGPDDPYMDTDTTAFAIYVDQALGLNRISRGAAVFDSRWNEETQEYHHLTNVDIPEMFTTLSILEAYLRDPAISRERQRALWEHSVNHLEQRVWIQGGFVSPLVLWDKIIQVFFTYEHLLPRTDNPVAPPGAGPGAIAPGTEWRLPQLLLQRSQSPGNGVRAVCAQDRAGRASATGSSRTGARGSGGGGAVSRPELGEYAARVYPLSVSRDRQADVQCPQRHRGTDHRGVAHALARDGAKVLMCSTRRTR